MTAARAFTLLELLIVVAIIAILAAIAVPNFLTAQTRAKVARVRADMRSAETALTAYRVDHGAYPAPDGFTGELGDLTTAQLDEQRLPATLTTPVGYLHQLLSDVFLHGADRRMHYLRRTVAGSVADRTSIEVGHTRAPWHLLSVAPDGVYDVSIIQLEGEGIVRGWRLVIYDPTNGAVSSGDLIRFGGGIGFRN